MSFPKRKRPTNVRVLRDWVRDYATHTDQAETRVSRALSFMLVQLMLERARTAEGDPEFIVKGGVSMELRLGLEARATKDFDAIFASGFERWLAALDRALAEPVDGFTFARSEPVAIRQTNTFRVVVAIDFKGRRWGQVRLEVAPAEAAHVLDVDQVAPFDIGQFGLTRPRPVHVAGLPYLIAQKLHARTEVFDGAENQRVQDLMDLLLARDLLGTRGLRRAREGCVAIFTGRGKHTWPPEVIVYPSWPPVFAKLAADESFPISDVDQAAELVRRFIRERDNAA
jgi:hypothetical protein